MTEIPQSNPPTPGGAPRPKGKGKLLALGCGVPLGILVLLLIIGSLAGDSPPTPAPAKTASSSNVPSNAPVGQQAASKSGGAANGAAVGTGVAAYSGKWQGQDGTSIWIRGEKGDYDGGNVKVQGGGVTLDEGAKKLKISSFFGIGKEWTIDSPPHPDGGHVEMTLSGLVYRRSGGFTPGTSGTAFDEAKVPSTQALRLLAQDTILAFDAGVKKRDFTAFHRTISSRWSEQTSPQELKTTFKSFMDVHANFSGIKNIAPVFTPAPRIDEDGVLQLKGYYPSGAARLFFELSYAPEDAAWKLQGISLNFKKG